MRPASRRRRNMLVGAAAFVLVSYRDDAARTVRGAMSDHLHPAAELAGQLAVLATIALLPLMLLAWVLFVALDWIRDTTERMLLRSLPFALAMLIAARTILVQQPSSSHLLRPRPVF